MSRRAEILAIVGILIALITLVFGDNFYFQVTGRSFGEDFRKLFSNQPAPATETSSPTVIPLASSQILLSDDFNDSSYFQGYNTNLWTCYGCESGSITQEDGSIRFEINGITGISVQTQSSWQASQIGYIQGKFKITEYDGADNGDVHLVLGTNLESGWWQTLCYIEGKQNSTKLSFTCSVVTVDSNKQEKYEYFSESTSVNYGDWHTAKIELNPNTMELRFYFDDKMLGQHTPANADELKDKNLKAQFGVSSNNTSRHIVASVDDVLIVQVP